MRNRLIGALLAAGLGVLTAPGVRADAKKDTPKPQKIKEADPARVNDPDFKVQGEYQGVNAQGIKLGAQVVALGNGKFDVRVLPGGLPGAGWDGKTELKATAGTEGGKVTLTGKGISGTIDDGVLNLKDDHNSSAALKRIDRSSPTLGEKPPQGAVVLWGGPADVSAWEGGNVVKLSDGEFLGVGEKSKKTFGDFRLHVEFRLPYQPNDRGQGRGNSGVYLQDRYEIQVLDSFGLKGENNECGGVYTQYAPSVNMCLPPLVWQTYDVDFVGVRYDADGKKSGPARATVYHNGVKIHDNIELKGPTGGGQPEKNAAGPIQLQNHGDPVVYRNIWVVKK